MKTAVAHPFPLLPPVFRRGAMLGVNWRIYHLPGRPDQGGLLAASIGGRMHQCQLTPDQLRLAVVVRAVVSTWLIASGRPAQTLLHEAA